MVFSVGLHSVLYSRQKCLVLSKVSDTERLSATACAFRIRIHHTEDAAEWSLAVDQERILQKDHGLLVDCDPIDEYILNGIYRTIQRIKLVAVPRASTTNNRHLEELTRSQDLVQVLGCRWVDLQGMGKAWTELWTFSEARL